MNCAKSVKVFPHSFHRIAKQIFPGLYSLFSDISLFEPTDISALYLACSPFCSGHVLWLPCMNTQPNIATACALG